MQYFNRVQQVKPTDNSFEPVSLLKDEKYMELAIEQADKAFDQGEFPVGAVIVFNDTVVASGSRVGTSLNEKYPSEIYHAEIRALESFQRFIASKVEDINSTSNIDSLKILPEQSTIYCTMEPCLMCFGAIIISGIKRVVYAFEDPMGGGTSCDLSKLAPLYRDSRLTIVPHILRDKSLDLFARFFSKKDNLYWKNSFLEKYTIEQSRL